MRFHTLPTLALMTSLAACTDPQFPTSPPPERQTAAVATTYDCASQSEIPEAECEALVSLYNSTAGSGWTNNTGWLATNAPCSWYGVVCSGIATLQRLDLGGNQLTGTIPAELGQLADLEVLILDYNHLTGDIPPGLGNLSRLTDLYLSNNQLSGAIPPQLGNTALRALNLAVNQLTGPVPPELGNLTNLQWLQLGTNSLSGSIPAELGNLSNLETLDLHSDRYLSGSIPPELGNLANLEYLFLGDNQLSGTLPAELGNLSKLLLLNVSYNDLTGPIPPQLGDLEDLHYLILSANLFTGPIPVEIGQLTHLVTLDLWGNSLGSLLPLPVAMLGGSIGTGCTAVPGNPGLYMPDLPDYRAADLDHDGLICGLGFTATPETAGMDLISTVEALFDDGVLSQGQSNALTGKVDQALKQYGKGNLNGALGALGAFGNQVNSLSTRHVITPAQAAALMTRVEVLAGLVRGALTN